MKTLIAVGDHEKLMEVYREYTVEKAFHSAHLGRGVCHFEHVRSCERGNEIGPQGWEYPALQNEVSGLLDREQIRSEEKTSELQSLMRISYAVFCFQKQ